MSLLLLVVAVVLLATANGANDNFKGVATLYGSGTLGYRAALALATLATFAGSLAALSLGTALVGTFSGKGLVPDAIVARAGFLGAVGLGAAATVLIATAAGLPVSTTHALTGALVGAGYASAGTAVNLAQLGAVFAAPLLLSPLLASALTAGTHPLAARLARRLGIERETCICLGREVRPVPAAAGSAAAAATLGAAPTLALGTTHTCYERYRGAVVGVSAEALATSVHTLSAAALSFARGLNDTPKIVALLLAARFLAPERGLIVVGVAMAVGGIVAARRVAETMSHRITAMSPGQALTGNVASALLVLLASRLGLAVSTTHVTCGALFGIGAASRQARWGTVGEIAGAWLATLPLAAALGAAAAAVLLP